MSKLKLKERLNNLQRMNKDLPVIIGNMALNHFTKSFVDGGFTDSHLVRWPKRNRIDAGRAILVKSGALKGAMKLSRATFNSIVISNRTKYAAVHNYGLEVKKPARSGTVYFGENDRTGRHQFTNSRNKSKLLNHTGRKVQIGAHSFTMKKRQFIGDSKVLNKNILSLIDKRLGKI